jgi:adenosylhomocysteine nucleosidase
MEATMSSASELLDAVRAGDAARVTALVRDDPALAATRGKDGVSALMLSRYRFDRAVSDALLAADPELDIFEATALGYIDRLNERLLEDPSRVDAFSPDGFTALHFAAFFGKPESARVLLQAGAPVDVYTRNDFANLPLHAAAAGRNIEVCRMLLAAGSDVNARQHGGFTPLHEAAQHGDVEMAELFLSAGADPSVRADDGATPGEIAARAGHADLSDRISEVAAARVADSES